MSDILVCAMGSSSQQVAMVRGWIERGESMWASPALDGVNVHIHAVTRDGLDAGVNVDPEEAAVLADYAASIGHRSAASLAKAWRQVNA